MSEETRNRVVARSKARELTAEEMTQISAGGGTYTWSTGTSVPSGDSVNVEDDVIVS